MSLVIREFIVQVLALLFALSGFFGFLDMINLIHLSAKKYLVAWSICILSFILSIALTWSVR